MKQRPDTMIISVITAVLLAASTGRSRTLIAFVGNSITQWSGYVPRLEALMGTGYSVHNAGSAGKCVLKNARVQWPVDGPYWDTEVFRSVFTAKPGIIVIKLGTNDSKPENWTPYKGEFFRDYSALIDTFLTITPTPRIYLALPVPAFSPACCNINPTVINREIVPLIDSLARTRNLSLIDCHTPLLNSRAFFPDGVHPDTNGARVIAESMHAVLTAPVSAILTSPAPLNEGRPIHSQGRGVNLRDIDAQGRIRKKNGGADDRNVGFPDRPGSGTKIK